MGSMSRPAPSHRGKFRCNPQPKPRNPVTPHTVKPTRHHHPTRTTHDRRATAKLIDRAAGPSLHCARALSSSPTVSSRILAILQLFRHLNPVSGRIFITFARGARICPACSRSWSSSAARTFTASACAAHSSCDGGGSTSSLMVCCTSTDKHWEQWTDETDPILTTVLCLFCAR